MSDKPITHEDWTSSIWVYRLDALHSIITEIKNIVDNPAKTLNSDTINSLKKIYNSKLHESFIKESHKYKDSHLSKTEFYRRFYRRMVNSYLVNPKNLYEKFNTELWEINSSGVIININIKDKIDYLTQRRLTQEDIFNILQQVEEQVKIQGEETSIRDLDTTKKGGSRKRRKSICKNYNKKCKHYTKKYKLKHKIKHKNTNRQKYQKQK